MDAIFFVLRILCGIVSVVCLIIVIIKMFNEGESTIGIVCIVTSLLCGIGGLITFVYGWMKVREWDLLPVMLGWSGAIVLGILAAVGQAMLGGGG